jgi:hypothetical protein
MNRTSFAFAVLFGLTIAGAGAQAEPVMHGAMDICQAVDEGTTTVSNGVEVCCAQEVTEYDDGHIDFGEKYCVACVAGTDNCVYEEVARNTQQQTIRNMTKSLAAKTKKAPVTAN